MKYKKIVYVIRNSFLQCLDKDTLLQKWNISIPGKIEGTPVMGDFVYLVHNTISNGTASGHLSLISFDGELVYNETRENVLFAPLAIQLNPIQGPYTTGTANRNDLLAWGKKYDPDYNVAQVKTRANYFFQLPKGNIDFTTLNNQIRTGGITGFTLSAPTLTGRFTNKYLALEFYKIRGFVTNTASTELRRWEDGANLFINPPQNTTLRTVPPPNGPLVLDAYDNSGYIFVTGSRYSKGVFAYKLSDQSMVSNFTDVGFIGAKMQVAMDDSCLFFIQETDSGSNITGVDYVAGTKEFEVMINATNSEFSIFNDLYLVYGTNAGYVNVIKLRDTEDDLIASNAPSKIPSPSPSTKPSAALSNTPSATPSRINSKPPSVHNNPTFFTPAPTPNRQNSTSAPTPANQLPAPTATSSAITSTTISVFGISYLFFYFLVF